MTRGTVRETSFLLIGDMTRPEFREAAVGFADVDRVVDARDVREALDVVHKGDFAPDVIVVAQSRPGEIDAAAIDTLRRQVPLARVLMLLGSWCEGETRSGDPLPATTRWYWHQWLPRFLGETSPLAVDRSPLWCLPVTATEEERLLISERSKRRNAADGLVAIQAANFDMADLLAQACATAGYATVRLHPPGKALAAGVTAAIFDGVECRHEEVAALGRLADEINGAPIVALFDFPRWEDRRRALAAGATSVVGKPLLVADLIWRLEEAHQRASASAGRSARVA